MEIGSTRERRRAIAQKLVDEVWNAGGGVTRQNLSEFFLAVTRKDYLVSQRILMRRSTDSNSGSPVKTVASTRWAVATQKASA